MSITNYRSGSWIRAILPAMLIGCSSCADQTTVILSVSGLTPDITTLRLTATMPGSQTTLEYTPAPLIGLRLPGVASGEVTLMLSGLAASGCLVATGQGSTPASGAGRVDASVQLTQCSSGADCCSQYCQPVNSVQNCGGCAIACSTNHIAPTCTAGACDGVCAAGYSDCDGDKRTNGCETKGLCLMYSSPHSYSAGSYPIAVAMGDFNRDNKPELITANLLGDDLGVLWGNGLGGPRHQVRRWRCCVC